MEQAAVEHRYMLGSVTVDELNEVLAEVLHELADPESESRRDAPPDADLASLTGLEAREAEEGDGGVTVAILIWLAGWAGGKALDYVIDEVVRPRLRRRFRGRDLGAKLLSPPPANS